MVTLRRRPLLAVALGFAAFAIVLVVRSVALAWIGPGRIVDGWGVGEAYTCTDQDPVRPCSVLLPLAQKALDHRDPSHAPVVSAALYREGPDASGNLVTRSTPLSVALFHLADGSVRAIGVGYPGVAATPMTLDYGP